MGMVCEPPPTEVGASSVRLGLYASSHICWFGGAHSPHPIGLITLWAIDASSLGADAPSSATCHTQNLSVTHLSLYRNSSPTKDGKFSRGILYKVMSFSVACLLESLLFAFKVELISELSSV